MLPPYQQETYTDFTDPAQVEAFCHALEKVRSDAGRRYPLVIGGERIQLEDVTASINPARPSEVLGYFSNATPELAARAVEVAYEAFHTWRCTPAEARARYLLKAAAAMRRRKHEFSATMVLEVGKSWSEADADTSEAIDFLEYYARQMLRLADSSGLLVPLAGEHLTLEYIPLGVSAVIPPWNFPCAIPTGMLSASIVAGNTAIFKPAGQSPLIAWKIAELFWENHIPAGVVNFLTGPGRTAGAKLVEHPLTRLIAFTGSREVGTWIHETAAKVQPSQKWLKRTVLEMGGKDGIIVDETADLDEAAKGIVQSAFGFQGQKCSACSRAIIVDEVYDRVAEKVVHLVRHLSVGATDTSPKVYMGPVVDSGAMRSILNYIEIGRHEGDLLVGGHAIETEEGGFFIAPTVIGEVPPHARIAQEEIFGPVLALLRANDFAHALEIANDTDYGLTGAVYSKDQARLEQARAEFFVGNLYFNRKCTGAMVGSHPFGGFNMSGTDSKAGGPDYLLLFTQAKVVAEKL